jgi:hypothetical protein
MHYMHYTHYIQYLPICAASLACAGCVTVNPSNVHVSGILGSSTPPATESPAATPREPAYAHTLRKVIHQQDKVAKELERRDWSELVDESGDWVEYTRSLIGYADTSHDPTRFRQHANKLLAATQAVRRAARQRDARACERALEACDPPLDQLCRDFPLTVSPARQAPKRTGPAHRQSNQRPARVP